MGGMLARYGLSLISARDVGEMIGGLTRGDFLAVLYWRSMSLAIEPALKHRRRDIGFWGIEHCHPGSSERSGVLNSGPRGVSD